MDVIKRKTNVTTKAHYQYFKKRFLYWAEVFSLGDFEFFFEHIGSKNLAQTSTNLIGRNARIGFSKNWAEVQPTRVAINHTAFHEAVEVLLSGIRILAKERYVTIDEIAKENHAVIRRLEKAMLGQNSSDLVK